jgi:hypothetical protein
MEEDLDKFGDVTWPSLISSADGLLIGSSFVELESALTEYSIELTPEYPAFCLKLITGLECCRMLSQ